MGIAQTPKIEGDLHALLPDNPFVPPKGDTCFINDLPPELLSRIFECGAADNDFEDEDDGAECWDDFHRHIEPKDADGKGTDIETTEEREDEDEEDDEEGTVDEDDSDATGSSDIPSPLPPFQIAVSHVCHHWRNIAFSTPSLWTTIVVSPDSRPPYEHVSTLLERSKGLPIDIYVSCDAPDDESEHDETDFGPPSDADLKFLFSLLIPHAHRWHIMEVSVSEYHHMDVFLDAASDPSVSVIPQLTKLELYHHDEAEEYNNGHSSLSEHRILFGGSAPSLTSIVLWGVHVDWNQPWIASASKLTELELAYHLEGVRPSWVQFVSILRSAPSLEKLSLQMSGPFGDPPEWFIEPTPGSPSDLNAPIQLLKVTDLILAFQPQTRAIGLLRKLYLPTLKNMVLDFEDGDFTDFVHELARPAASSSPSPTQEQSGSLLSRLESLKIAGLPCRTVCVKKLYGELQNLTSLNISLIYLPSLFLDILSMPCDLAGRGGVWLPRLETLYISGTSGGALRSLVQKRKRAGVPLQSLYVEESSDLTCGDTRWLRENVKTFDIFEGSDDEDVVDFDDLHEDLDEWSDMD